MVKCRDCKYWMAPRIASESNMGDCRLLGDDAEYDRPNAWRPEEWPEPMAGTVPFAGADGASFVTLPNFGCVQGEPK